MKKSISFILVMLMVLCMVPGVALADMPDECKNGTCTHFAAIGTTHYDTLDNAISAAQPGDEITIIKNLECGFPSLTKSITIKAATGVSVTFGTIGTPNLGGANVTFENITFNYANANYKGLQHSGDIVYNNCIINGQAFFYGDSVICNDCTFNQTSADAYNVWTYGAKHVEFNGCTFNCAGKSVLVYNEGGPATELIVKDTDFVASSSVTGKAAIEIDTRAPNAPGAMDGTKIVIDDKTTATGFDNGSVSGNTLWNDKKDLTNLEVWVASTQVWPEYVAKIGDKGYASMKAAVDAAQDGETVVVTQNHVVNCNDNPVELQTGVFALINAADKAVTIDLNGKSVTGTVNFSGNRFILFSSSGTGHLTLKDSEGGGGVNLTAVSNVYALMMAFDPSSYLTVEGGSYQIDKVESALCYSAGSDTVTINGGTFHLGNVDTGENGSPWIFNAKGQNERHVNVNGGTFNAEVNNQYWIFEAQMPANKALKNNGDGTWTVVDAVAWVNVQKKSGKWYTYEKGFATLEEAIAAAEENANTVSDINTNYNENNVSGIFPKTNTVTLVQDCVVEDTLEIDADMTIELKDKTIIWEGDGTAPIFNATKGTLTIADFTPIRTGYTFGGWYTDEARTSSYNLAEKGTVEEGASLYAKWNVDASNPSASPEITPAPKSSGSGIKVEYEGGNSFSTSKSAVPTSVEIDGQPVPFNGDGSSFTVGCIDPNAKWVTVKWNSTTVTTNFTPDGLVECSVSIPKTGDVSIWATIAEFLGF